jgi:hypothetical protein
VHLSRTDGTILPPVYQRRGWLVLQSVTECGIGIRGSDAVAHPFHVGGCVWRVYRHNVERIERFLRQYRLFSVSTATARGCVPTHGASGTEFHVLQEPRLFLTETLDDCVAAATDLTFDNGRLLPNVGDYGTTSANDRNSQQQHRKYFTVDSLEVWGVGGTAVTLLALQQREAARAVTQEAIRRARKVDKAQFLDDFRTGTFASKAFQHRQEADGRANEDMDERARDPDKTYQYS